MGSIGFSCAVIIFWSLQISLISLGAEGMGMGNIGAFRALRTLRALRPLRAVSRWEGMKASLSTLQLFLSVTLLNKTYYAQILPSIHVDL